MQALGIDVGGSGIKGAPVEIETGRLLTERFRIPTPQPATPAAMIEVAAQVIRHFEWAGPIGCGFPAAIKQGEVLTAANIDQSWIGVRIEEELGRVAGMPVRVLNDADAAGLAEMRWGAGREQQGVVLILTLGTGIGSAVFIDGRLVPNTELGHIEIRGKAAERRASNGVRELKQLSWKQWAKRINEYLAMVERLLWPDLMIIGGGASTDADHFLPLLRARAPIVRATMLNNAGIAGAALAGCGATD